jgi:uncharacterized protein with HEPN domain
MNPPDLVRLRHMLDALEMAVGFTRGRSRPDLDKDDMLRMALVQAVAIAGEAAHKVTPGTRAELSDLPWASIVGMRNRLIHAYFDIDRDILWTTVAEAAPSVAMRLRALIGEK